MYRPARLILLALVLLAGCRSDGDVRVVKLGHGLDPAHPVHQAITFMADRLAEKSSGQIRIDIYPSQQLGGERELLELLQLGSLGMTKVSAAVLEGFVPSFSVLSMPYLFRNDAHRFHVLEGPIGQELLRDTKPFWLRGLVFYDAGSRSFYTKEKPILHPDDLAGMKIRTMESTTQMQMVNRLGGSATPISWGELYTSLQQGIVDGAENNMPSFYTSRHFEVCRYLSLDEHTSTPDVLLVSTHLWNDLSAEEQGWLVEAARESAEHQKVLWREASARALDAVREAGVEVHQPDKAPFRARVEPLYDALEGDPEIGDLVRRIREDPGPSGAAPDAAPDGPDGAAGAGPDAPGGPDGASGAGPGGPGGPDGASGAGPDAPGGLEDSDGTAHPAASGNAGGSS